MTDSTEHASPAGVIPAGPPFRAGRSGLIGLVRAGWLLFRGWRRSRPFWGGILLVIAGAELLLIPLPMHSMGLILHIGIGGISGILIGAVLIVAGLLLWFNPAQRLFYSIVAVLLAIAALVASNLGGFLLGTILGVVGGSLGFAWTPLPPGTAPRRLWRRKPTTPADTVTDLVPPSGDGNAPHPDAALAGADTDVDETTDDSSGAAPTAVSAEESSGGRLDPNRGAAGSGGGTVGPRHSARYAEAGPRTASRYSRSAPCHRISASRGTVIGSNIFAILVGLLTLGLINLGPTPSPTPTADPPGAAATPDPSASPTASPSPAASASTSPSASTTPGANSTPIASPSPSPAPTGSVPSFAIASVQSTLRASSASLTDFVYDGVVSVPTATGTVQMMQFSASSLDLSGVNLAVVQGGATITTTASSLDFNGNVVLYATQLSGDLLGVPTTLTPGNALSTILQILGQLGLTQTLTQAIPLTMTNVTTLQPFTSANDMTTSALHIS